jgi:transposase-like protein
VALVTEQGYKPSETARGLGIGDRLIRRWKREFQEDASGTPLGTDERFELIAYQVAMRLEKIARRVACSTAYRFKSVYFQQTVKPVSSCCVPPTA